jgi:hypothetical protein
MAVLFFHLRAGELFLPDLEGADIQDARATARHLMRLLRRAGEGNHSGWRFEITDESGEFVDSIPVEELIGAVH